ncbi:MAG: hypothetical protein MUF39_05565, partial [Cyclobacteriaceae bacterium]|nr:hypothetical protein [Cyclobacteriaceae bacterium]
EEVIQKLEVEKQAIEIELAKPEVFSNFEKLNVVQQKFDILSKQLHEENQKWENIVLEMDQLELNG